MGMGERQDQDGEVGVRQEGYEFGHHYIYAAARLSQRGGKSGHLNARIMDYFL